MDSKPFTFEKNDGFVTVMLSRPDSGNRLLTEDIRALGRTIRELGEQADVKTVVIRAQGDAFCLGRQPAVGVQAPPEAG